MIDGTFEVGFHAKWDQAQEKKTKGDVHLVNKVIKDKVLISQ